MRLIIALLTLTVLAGCGTNAYNNRIAQGHALQLNAYQAASQAKAEQCSSAVAGCSAGVQGDMCRIATLLACNNGVGQLQLPSTPQYRSAAQDFAAIAGPITNGILGLAQVGATIYGIERNADTTIALAESRDRTLLGVVDSSNQGQATVAGQFGGILGDFSGLVGNLPPATQIGGDQVTIGGDQTSADNGSQIGDTRRDTLDNGAIIGDGNRQGSPGPFDNVDNTTNEPLGTDVDPPDPVIPPGPAPFGGE